MMDAAALYPAGFHPIQQDWSPDYTTSARVLPRTTSNVKYYFTDFGISRRFEADDDNRLVVGNKGLDQTLPELSDTVHYDPFKADIYFLGNVFKERFLQVGA